jgi:hypothetical protein
MSKVIRSRMAFRRTARSSDEPALDHLECHGLIRGGVPTTKHLDRSIVIRMSVQHKHKPGAPRLLRWSITLCFAMLVQQYRWKPGMARNRHQLGKTATSQRAGN